MFCGLQCTPYERLIDIAERNTSLHKIGDSLRIVPAIVPDFHHAWILNELPRQVLHILAVERRVLERDGKLNEQRAQPALTCKRFKSLPSELFVFVIRADAGGRSWFHDGEGIMGKGAMQFRGEHEFRIHRGRPMHPELGYVWLDVSVKRSIDLDHVEALRQQIKAMLLAISREYGVLIEVGCGIEHAAACAETLFSRCKPERRFCWRSWATLAAARSSEVCVEYVAVPSPKSCVTKSK